MISSDWQPVTYLRDKASQRGDLILSSLLLSSFIILASFLLFFSLPSLCSLIFDAVSCALSVLCLAPVCVSK